MISQSIFSLRQRLNERVCFDIFFLFFEILMNRFEMKQTFNQTFFLIKNIKNILRNKLNKRQRFLIPKFAIKGRDWDHAQAVRKIHHSSSRDVGKTNKFFVAMAHFLPVSQPDFRKLIICNLDGLLHSPNAVLTIESLKWLGSCQPVKSLFHVFLLAPEAYKADQTQLQFSEKQRKKMSNFQKVLQKSSPSYACII